MSLDASPKRQRIQCTDVSETVLDEATYVLQLLRVFGYEDVTTRIIDTLCDLIRDWIRVVAQPLTINGKEYFPYHVSGLYCDLLIVFAPTLSILLDSILSLFQRKEVVLKGKYNARAGKRVTIALVMSRRV